MPLPKNPDNIEEWKRKISLSMLVSNINKFTVQNSGTISTDTLPFPDKTNPVVTKGIYLVPPHGELIWKGVKKAIVKTRKFNVNEYLILVSGKKAYGIISIGQPREISKKEFDELKPKHRITDEEFKKWGWDGKQLYYYEVSMVKKFPVPKSVKVKKGTQTFINEVEFLSLIRKDVNPSDLSTKELLLYHSKLHAMYKSRPHNWSLEDIVNLHVLVVKELKKRGYKHIPYDKLDEDSKQFLEQLIKDTKNYDPSKLSDNVLLDDHRIVHAWWASIQKGKKLYHPDGSEITKEEIRRLHSLIVKELGKRGFKHNTPLAEELAAPERVEKLVDKLDDAVLIENFVSLVGSYITDKEKPGDIDFLLRFDRGTPEFIERATKVRIAKMLDDISDKLQFTWDPEGPHDDYIPVYDLVLRKKKIKLVNLAKTSITLGKPYLPQKPYGSATYEEDALLKKIKEDVTYSVEKKLNGFHVSVHKFDNNVKIFSEQKKDLTVAFPTLTKILSKVSTHNYIIDGELVPEKGGRRALAVFVGAVKRGEKADDSHVKLYVWDITYFDKDISNLPLKERKEILKKLKFCPRVINTPYVFVKGKDKVLKAVKKMSSFKDSEGAVLKDINSTYHFGEHPSWFKHRKLADIHAVVIERISNQAGGYNYKIGIYIPNNLVSKINPKYLIDFNNKKVMVLGKTFNTDVKANPGDIIDVLVEEIWRHRKNDKIRYSVHKPRFKMLRPDLSKTSSLKDLDAIVVSTGVEVKE